MLDNVVVSGKLSKYNKDFQIIITNISKIEDKMLMLLTYDTKTSQEKILGKRAKTCEQFSVSTKKKDTPIQKIAGNILLNWHSISNGNEIVERKEILEYKKIKEIIMGIKLTRQYQNSRRGS